MFNFLNMRPYEQRNVDYYHKGKLDIDTSEVPDGSSPFETGIRHPDYNYGEWIIVEAYNNRENAQSGHNRWVESMAILPDELTDCANSFLVQCLEKQTFERVRS